MAGHEHCSDWITKHHHMDIREQGTIDPVWQAMSKHGFQSLGRCTLCGAGLFKYQRGNVIVYVKPKIHIFRVRIGGSYVTEWKDVKEIDETVKQIISEEAA